MWEGTNSQTDSPSHLEEPPPREVLLWMTRPGPRKVWTSSLSRLRHAGTAELSRRHVKGARCRAVGMPGARDVARSACRESVSEPRACQGRRPSCGSQPAQPLDGLEQDGVVLAEREPHE